MSLHPQLRDELADHVSPDRFRWVRSIIDIPLTESDEPPTGVMLTLKALTKYLYESLTDWYPVTPQFDIRA